MKKVLTLVLSCETPPYNEMMKVSMETWDSRIVEGVETIYYCGKSKNTSTDKVVYLTTEDSFLTMGAKTIEAFEWALNNKEFDYLARPNSSCYVRKQILLNYVQNLPAEKVYLGLKVASCYKVDYVWGGGQCILSRDVVELVVKNKEKWNHTYTEDVALAALLVPLGVPINGSGNACALHVTPSGTYTCITYENNGGGGIEFTDMAEMAKLENQFFIRVKQDQKRHLDLHVMRELHKSNI